MGCSVDTRSPELDDGIAQSGAGGAGNDPPLPGQGGSSGSAGDPGGGGTSPAAGSAGQPSAAGTGGTGEDPQQAGGGYFQSAQWQGYAWTAVDSGGSSSISPASFGALAAGDPYCVEGNVGADASGGGFAQLGFNLDQAAGATPAEAGPVLEVVPSALGVAINIQRTPPPAGSGLTPAPLWRLELRDLSGQVWCAPLPAADGAAFIRYEPHAFDTTIPHFRKNCWDVATSVPYEREPIASVAVTIPGGTTSDYHFDACVSGLLDTGEEFSGELDTRFARAKVVVEGEGYIINNNALGSTSTEDSQSLLFVNNGFEVLYQTADPTPDGSPISFPSIYIGSNGPRSGLNAVTTSDTDQLPIQVSAITSIPTRFRHNAEVGDYNATYELWFSPNAPTGEYDRAGSAYVMIWTYKPGNRSPIGTRGLTVSVGGRNWAIYSGPRGGAGPDANVPVISFVNEGQSLLDYSFDLKVFIDDVVARDLGVSSTMFLTDVFAGFEIWDEGAAVQLLEFTAAVNP